MHGEIPATRPATNPMTYRRSTRAMVRSGTRESGSGCLPAGYGVGIAQPRERCTACFQPW